VVDVRRAETADLASVVAVLNAATLKLLGLGVQQWTYPWDAPPVREAIERREWYLVVHDEQSVATFRMSRIDGLSSLSVEPNSLYLSQLAVHPRYQGQGVGAQILGFAQACSQRCGVALYVDCWAGNAKLRAFYAAHGFEGVGDFPEADYFVHVFRFPGATWEGSSDARMARRHRDSAKTRSTHDGSGEQ
jgi:GNAT superfamily N-acetyltransferase